MFRHVELVIYGLANCEDPFPCLCFKFLFKQLCRFLCASLLFTAHCFYRRDTSLRDRRSESGDHSSVGNSNENLALRNNRDRETESNQNSREDSYGRENPHFQSGVLRTNCIDCLDRTNVAQYAYGLEALGRQLHVMGLTDLPKLDPHSSIATALMDMYQSMGDALAQQYGGSEAHNTVIVPF